MSDQQEGTELGELYQTVEFGLDVAQFLRSPIGQYLLRKAAEERTDALAGLVDVAAEDCATIGNLQSIIKRVDSLEFWLTTLSRPAKTPKPNLTHGRMNDRPRRPDGPARRSRSAAAGAA